MAEIKMKISGWDAIILGTLSPDEGSSLEWLLDELDMSEATLRRHISKLRILGLVRRHFDDDDELLIYRTIKGSEVIEKIAGD